MFVSIAVNLGILGFFKYFNFFIDSTAGALDSVGLEPNLPTLTILLPVGISFYTFQTLGYTIDVYRGKLEPTDRPPRLRRLRRLLPAAGGRAHRAGRPPPAPDRAGARPPGRARDPVRPLPDPARPLPQGRHRRRPRHRWSTRSSGAPGRADGCDLLLGIYAFSLQIYGDFAGYSDIARGTSRLLGIELMENFRQPYLRANITHFWRRWHISLSTWLRDYLYIPLGGNRRGSYAPTAT